MNKGTKAAMIAANPPLIYSTDQVSRPLAIHNKKILCTDIFFNISLLGILYPLSRK